ncbi:MAG: ribosome recycling factor, partial [Gammaproteobacteria bacterium]|nr:ribosome recycling factor [Gammaproteobacteria bacterium]
MIDEIIADARERMEKSLHSLESAFNKIRTGRAHPGILDSVMVNYYGTETPIQQVANITIEDARTIAVTPWEKNLLGDVEKAI